MGQVKCNTVECPVCGRNGKQKIINGFLCYAHGRGNCCKWAEVMNLEDLLNPDGEEVLLFMRKMEIEIKCIDKVLVKA